MATTTTVRLEPNVIEELDRVGKIVDRSRSWIIKEAIAQYLEYNRNYELELQEGLSDYKAGRLVSHEDVIASLRLNGCKID